MITVCELRESWTREKVEERVKALLPLTNLVEIKQRDPKTYSALRRLKCVDAVKEIIRANGGKPNEHIVDYSWERIVEIHDGCESWEQFFAEHKPAWRSATAMGRMEDLRNRGLSLRKKWSVGSAAKFASNLATRRSAISNHRLLKKHLGTQWQTHLPPSSVTIIEDWEIGFAASNCRFRNEFKIKFPRHYDRAQDRGILEHVCRHMSPPPVNRSVHEILLFEFVKSLCPDTEANVWLSGNPRSSVDIFVPSSSLAIEFNGLKWHSERHKGEKMRWVHLLKQQACADRNVRLMHFWAHEKTQVIHSVIRNSLHMPLRRLSARKGEIAPVDYPVAKAFLDRSHIQGYGTHRSFRINVGLYFDGVLEAVMSFSPSEFRNGEGADWSLVRFACSLDTSISGAASRLFSHRPSGTIVSYSDNRLFDGALYEILGFEKVGVSAPDYFYEKDGIFVPKREGRHSAMKKRFANYSPDLVETEQMASHGYFRVWDCGKTKWVYS